jgi:thioredoxin-like negative regulator of GroEL
MTPIVNGLKETYGRDFTIVFVDIDTRDGKRLAREHGFMGQPTFIFFDEFGEAVRRLQGPQSVETFQQQIERLLEN